jgi:hypothetical protein
MKEVPLSGGRRTAEVVRVGDTVRRPSKPNSQLVRTLLMQLRDHGFDGAPRYLGSDGHGREVFSFLLGDVPSDLDPAIPDDTLAAAARLIRRFHDATAGTELSGVSEVVCHNDLSPCNFVCREDKPVGSSTSTPPRLESASMTWLRALSLGQPRHGRASAQRTGSPDQGLLSCLRHRRQPRGDRGDRCRRRRQRREAPRREAGR